MLDLSFFFNKTYLVASIYVILVIFMFVYIFPCFIIIIICMYIRHMYVIFELLE